MAGLIRRGKKFYALYYVAKEQKRVCLHTESLQVAKEKIRQLESAMVRGEDNPLPTKTPTENVVAAYIDYMRSTKLERNVQRDLSYLRDAFGPICPALVLKNPKARKPIVKTRRPPVSKIEVRYFEQIATVDISQYISAQVRAKGLAPKTANRYREILTRLFNWSMEQFGIRLPNDNESKMFRRRSIPPSRRSDPRALFSAAGREHHRHKGPSAYRVRHCSCCGSICILHAGGSDPDDLLESPRQHSVGFFDDLVGMISVEE